MQFNEKCKGLKELPSAPTLIKRLPSPITGILTKSKLNPLSRFIQQLIGLKKYFTEIKPEIYSALRELEIVKIPSPSPGEIKKRSHKSLIRKPQQQFFAEEVKKGFSPQKKSAITFCLCGNKCEDDDFECDKCIGISKMRDYSGYMHIKSSEKSGQLKRYWCQLLGNQLFSNLFTNNSNRIFF